eukprot:3243759-Pyramimonas_sp.AAC.1
MPQERMYLRAASAPYRRDVRQGEPDLPTPRVTHRYAARGAMQVQASEVREVGAVLNRLAV